MRVNFATVAQRGDKMTTIYTVGHSTHTAEKFLNLLQKHGITAIADVRSSPYSRMNPQFNREVIQATLKKAGIQYVFLGAELGARASDPGCYIDGKVQYGRIAAKAEFIHALERIESGAAKFKIALMCAEGDPLTCHRTILVGRCLIERGAELRHIRVDGSIETHDDALARLLAEVGLGKEDMFRPLASRVAEAYARREADIAYTERPRSPAEDAEERETHP